MNQVVEISVVYFTAGYTSTGLSHKSSARFDVRLLMEQSYAIKCHPIQPQLAVSEVQQVLTKSGVLKSFLLEHARWDGLDLTEADIELLRNS